jgi:hypothetical protein
MDEHPLTIWEHAELRGYSRRDFLRFASWLAAMAGLEASGVGNIVKAMDAKPRIPVVWFHFQECTCCSESFIRSSHPIVADIILDKISLDYTQTLQAAAGKQAEDALQATMKKYKGEYLMLVEGSIPTAEGGVYCCIGGRTAEDIVRKRPPAQRRSSRGEVALRMVAFRRRPPIRRLRPRCTNSCQVFRSSTFPAARPSVKSWRRRSSTSSLLTAFRSSMDSAGRRRSTNAAFTIPAIAVRTTMRGSSWSRSTTKTRAADTASTRWDAADR